MKRFAILWVLLTMATLAFAGVVFDPALKTSDGLRTSDGAATVATGAEVTTGTNNTKMVTPKALADANIKATTWSIITGAQAYSATSGDGYFFDSTANAVTLTLPTPTLGANVRWVTKNVTNTTTVARNGSEKIEGSAGNLVLNALSANGLVSDGTDWYLINK
jgi:hypothetical protein